jgi:outer membrane protein assembly factor BamB
MGTGSARSVAWLCAAALSSGVSVVTAQQALPSTPLHYGFFNITFASDGVLTLEGEGWPTFKGTWKAQNDEVTILTTGGPPACTAAGRYRFRREDAQIFLNLVADDCIPRRMILHDSAWLPQGQKASVAERKIVRTGTVPAPKLPAAAPADGSWPSFRGPNASGVADGQQLPDRWDGKTGENILWRTPIPGLAHSSPIVWGDRVFVTSAISSKPGATFKPGLYGDGDASEDRSRHKWMLYAIDKGTGKIVWERIAFEGEPRNKRHIKSTYASATPATDGRLVVAWFGSQGVHAYDVNGNPLWQVDLGRVDMGAYDIPSYEWGPASSPIIWNGLVLLQCDTQADSFVIALDAGTGKTVWKTARQELPSWGTPTVIATGDRDELVTNAANYIRGYDARTGEELWRLGGSSKITAPTPIFANGLIIVASGRRPERPIFAVRANARGDLTLEKDKTSSSGVAWSKTGRGSYMPTPLVYDRILYALNNDGVFDAYDVETGSEIYRQRLDPVGSGFSASPVAADGRLYLSNEDGEMLVVASGREFRLISTNRMGELLMATPAISNGVMYVRSASSLFAIGTQAAQTPRGPETPIFRVQVWGEVLPDFNKRVTAYFNLRSEMEKGLPPQKVTDDPAAIRSATRALAERIRLARAGAREGDIFTPKISVEFKKALGQEINPSTWGDIMDDNPGEFRAEINGSYPEEKTFSTVPPNILAALPRLPQDIQYRFLGRHLILFDVRASLIIDRIPLAIQCAGEKRHCKED